MNFCGKNWMDSVEYFEILNLQGQNVDIVMLTLKMYCSFSHLILISLSVYLSNIKIADPKLFPEVEMPVTFDPQNLSAHFGGFSECSCQTWKRYVNEIYSTCIQFENKRLREQRTERRQEGKQHYKKMFSSAHLSTWLPVCMLAYTVFSVCVCVCVCLFSPTGSNE